MFVGLMSDRGRGNIQSYVGNVVYTIVAMGMLSTVSWRQESDKPPDSVEGPPTRSLRASLVPRTSHCRAWRQHLGFLLAIPESDAYHA